MIVRFIACVLALTVATPAMAGGLENLPYSLETSQLCPMPQYLSDIDYTVRISTERKLLVWNIRNDQGRSIRLCVGIWQLTSRPGVESERWVPMGLEALEGHYLLDGVFALGDTTFLTLNHVGEEDRPDTILGVSEDNTFFYTTYIAQPSGMGQPIDLRGRR